MRYIVLICAMTELSVNLIRSAVQPCCSEADAPRDQCIWKWVLALVTRHPGSGISRLTKSGHHLNLNEIMEFCDWSQWLDESNWQRLQYKAILCKTWQMPQETEGSMICRLVHVVQISGTTVIAGVP
jgi:hypothetical protein